MKRALFSLFVILGLSSGEAPAQSPLPSTHLKVGDKAPDLTLLDQHNTPVNLSDYRGKSHIALFFFGHSFTAATARQLKAFMTDFLSFGSTGTLLLGVGRDAPPAHKKLAEELGLRFPVLSDTTGEAAKLYGIFITKHQIPRRASFVIDKEGVIRYIEQGATAAESTGALEACFALFKKN